MYKGTDVNSSALHKDRGILQVNKYQKDLSVGLAVMGPRGPIKEQPMNILNDGNWRHCLGT